MRKLRVYNFEDREMWIADDYEDLSNLFMALNADDSMFSEPMQYTGLFDKNDNEIFEGDIVRISMRIGKHLTTSIGVVRFDKIEVCFKIRNDLGGHYVTMFHASYFEVIGNIYENPELLEVKE